jgi:cell division protein FtsZ
LGAGSIPSVGKDAALENIEQIKSLLETNTKMLFITAGMGGGTGTGGAPVIASIAKELGILTVGIVTLPFSFEGNKRRQQAEQGVSDLRKHVDTLLVISNDKLRELYGNLKLSEAFGKADNILTSAAKGIAEIITVPGYINVDFEDVKTVMQNSGVAIMGTGVAEGENRARTAVEDALNSPLLNDNNIKGANNILLYITSGAEEISMDEVSEITDYIQNESGYNAEIIWGNGEEESLDKKISITIIATGFESTNNRKETSILSQETDRIIHKLGEAGMMEPVKTDELHEELLSEITLINNPGESASVISEPDNVVHETEKTYTFDLTVEEEREESGPGDSKMDPVNEVSEVKEGIENKSEIEKRALERIKKLKDLSIKLKTPAGVSELEKEPAYIRRKVELSEVPSSSDSEVSKYTLSSDDNSSTEIKTNNSFLHDNVD